MSIQEHLNKIRNAIKGSEVRESIAKGIETAYDDASENGNANMEVKLARGTNPNLNTRLNKMDEVDKQTTAQLAHKVNKGEVSIFDIDKNKGKLDETFLSDTLIEQITGDTSVSATIAKGSITRDKLTKRLINQEQTTFISKGKNIFNKDDLFRGYAINENNGEVFNSSTYRLTDYIGVESDTVYHRNLPSNVVFYDGTFNFISGIAESSGVFTTPLNAEYIRCSLGGGYVSGMQIEKGDTATEREDYKLTFNSLKLDELNFEENTIPIQSLKGLIQGKNLFDKSENLVNGYISIDTGDVIPSETAVTTNYIPIKSDVKYSRSHVGNFAFYDKQKNFLPVDLDEYHSGLYSFYPPLNAEFVRLTFNKNNIESFQFEEGERSDYEPFGYRIEGLLYDRLVSEPTIITNKKTRVPVPARVTETTSVPGNYTHVLGDIDTDGALWAIAWRDIIRKSEDGGKTWTTVLNAREFLESDETISMYAFYVTDVGRLICSTNKGRVLVSDLEQTELTEAFKFKAGYTQNTWGHCKYGKFILMGTYGGYDQNNPPREVYFSQDYGETWDLIFDKPIEDMKDPTFYHIHDVSFDPYSNMILIVAGDGLNHQIHYSYDFGKTWNEIIDESLYSGNYWAPTHPTSILCFPEGIAFGSDDLPEGISWWERPKNQVNPTITLDDIQLDYKNFGKETDTIIGTVAVKGHTKVINGHHYGVMAFQNHKTETEGHPRLFATGDGGRSWHEIFKETVWDDSVAGFYNVFIGDEEDDGKHYIYSAYSTPVDSGDIVIWKAELPQFF